MKLTRLLIGVLVAVSVAACGPVNVDPPPAVPRAFEIHTCVGGATVWVDGLVSATGALLPDPPARVTADPNGVVPMPALPGDVVKFTVHATAPGYPEYSAVIDTQRLPGEHLVIILGSCSR